MQFAIVHVGKTDFMWANTRTGKFFGLTKYLTEIRESSEGVKPNKTQQMSKFTTRSNHFSPSQSPVAPSSWTDSETWSAWPVLWGRAKGAWSGWGQSMLHMGDLCGFRKKSLIDQEKWISVEWITGRNSEWPKSELLTWRARSTE